MDDINVEAAFDAVARAALRRGEQDDDLYVVGRFKTFWLLSAYDIIILYLDLTNRVNLISSVARIVCDLFLWLTTAYPVTPWKLIESL